MLRVKRIADKFGLNITTVCCDATNELPFSERFDYVFQAGLLEHFYPEQRIDMLKKWKKNAKNMISLIPNAHCLAYRVGKQILEEKGTWEYGLEMPQSSLRWEFEQAGIEVLDEYTIDSAAALKLLPNDHVLRVALEKMSDHYRLEDFGQGYLLVTIGKC